MRMALVSMVFSSVVLQPPAQAQINSLSQRMNPKDSLIYIYIPAGSFSMGCDPGDHLCDDDEKPAHTVHVSKGFWITQTLIPQYAYQRVTGANPSRYRVVAAVPAYPVDTVTWREARAYCEQIGMRLPTEAEWEFAARAGGTYARFDEGALFASFKAGLFTTFPQPKLDAVSWNRVTLPSTLHCKELGFCPRPQPVDSKAKNGYGLNDMQGNLLEWVADRYGAYSAASTTDPKGPEQGDYRVLRGASFESRREFTRVSHRAFLPPDMANYVIGFRCAGERVPE